MNNKTTPVADSIKNLFFIVQAAIVEFVAIKIFFRQAVAAVNRAVRSSNRTTFYGKTVIKTFALLYLPVCRLQVPLSNGKENTCLIGRQGFLKCHKYPEGGENIPWYHHGVLKYLILYCKRDAVQLKPRFQNRNPCFKNNMSGRCSPDKLHLPENLSDCWFLEWLFYSILLRQVKVHAVERWWYCAWCKCHMPDSQAVTLISWSFLHNNWEKRISFDDTHKPGQLKCQRHRLPFGWSSTWQVLWAAHIIALFPAERRWFHSHLQKLIQKRNKKWKHKPFHCPEWWQLAGTRVVSRRNRGIPCKKYKYDHRFHCLIPLFAPRPGETNFLIRFDLLILSCSISRFRFSYQRWTSYIRYP